MTDQELKSHADRMNQIRPEFQRLWEAQLSERFQSIQGDGVGLFGAHHVAWDAFREAYLLASSPTPTTTDSDLRAKLAKLAKSEAMKADFAKVWNESLRERFVAHATSLVTPDTIFAAKEVAWMAFRDGRNT